MLISSVTKCISTLTILSRYTPQKITACVQTNTNNMYNVNMYNVLKHFEIVSVYRLSLFIADNLK